MSIRAWTLRVAGPLAVLACASLGLLLARAGLSRLSRNRTSARRYALR
jgi:hypothetical protein